MTRLTALVQSALCAGLARAALVSHEQRYLAAGARAYARTAGLSVPLPLPRATREAYSDETEVES